MHDTNRPIVFKVRLNQEEWDALEAMAKATGYQKGTLVRNFINQLPNVEQKQCLKN
jgi:predicted DNA-binding protein